MNTYPSTREQWEEMGDCPFCGAKAAEFNITVCYSESLKGEIYHYMGECAGCGAMGPTADTEEDALRLWTARPA